MKKVTPLLVLLFAVLPTELLSSHIVGGWLEYKYLGNHHYDVEVFVLRDPTALPVIPPIELFVANLSDNNDSTFLIPRVGIWDTLIKTSLDCHGVPGQGITYEIHHFRDTIELVPDSVGYKMITVQSSRAPLTNVPQQPQFMEYFVFSGDSGWVNSSPKWEGFYGSFGCEGLMMTMDLSAYDREGDSLVYYLKSAHCGTDPLVPPMPCNYVGGYSGTNPLSATTLNLDTNTGLFKCTPAELIPIATRKYLIKIGVDEYRSGKILGSFEKEFVITIAPCVPLVQAGIGQGGHQDSILICNSFTYQFSNSTTGGTSFHWDFDYPNGVDTSMLTAPTFIYSDTGTYEVILVAANDSCVDTAFTTVLVYPYLEVDFLSPDSICLQTQVQFTNLSTSTYDPIIGYQWFFGDGISSSQISPIHTYDSMPPSQTYQVKLVAYTSKGCSGTETKPVYLDTSPILNLSSIEFMCLGDTVYSQISSNGTAYSWLPNTGVECDTCLNTGLFPSHTTTYTLTAYNEDGCEVSDTIRVEVDGSGNAEISGSIQTSQGQPYQNGRVLLVDYNPLDSTVTAIDSTWTDHQGGFLFFTGQQQVYIKATPDSAAYPNELLTYYESGLVWDSADAITVQPCDSLFLSFSTISGTNPGGPGFIAGNVFQGAGKMLDRSDPIEGLTLILMDEAGNPVALTTTDQEGHYYYADLALGRYAIWGDKPFMRNNAAPEVELTSIDPTIDSLWIKYYDRQLFLDITSIPPTPETKAFSIYPNPSNSILFIESPYEAGAEWEITMVSTLGKEVSTRATTERITKIDIRQLPQGVYFVQLSYGNDTHIYPIMVGR